MHKISIALIIGLFLISCDSKINPLTVREFTIKYFDSLSNRFPSTKFQIVDDSTIITKFNANDIRISVDNAYREYRADPGSLQKVISKYVTVTSELFELKDKISIDRIVPIIKPVEYLDYIRNVATKMVEEKDVQGVYDKYNDQLVIAYAEDTKNSIRYLMQDDLKKLAINIDSLRTIATRNLDKLLTNIQRKGGDGVYMLTAGGDYEASIILLSNVLNKENIPVNGDLVIAIPNRDLLLITGSNDKAGIAKIKEVAAKSFSTGDHNVSEYLYKWNGNKFEKYE